MRRRIPPCDKSNRSDARAWRCGVRRMPTFGGGTEVGRRDDRQLSCSARSVNLRRVRFRQWRRHATDCVSRRAEGRAAQTRSGPSCPCGSQWTPGYLVVVPSCRCAVVPAEGAARDASPQCVRSVLPQMTSSARVPFAARSVSQWRQHDTAASSVHALHLWRNRPGTSVTQLVVSHVCTRCSSVVVRSSVGRGAPRSTE